MIPLALLKTLQQCLKSIHLFMDWTTEDQCVNYSEWKRKLKNRINNYENCLWENYVESHLHLFLLHQTFSEISPTAYRTITSLYLESVPKLNIQLRLTVNFGLQSGLQWLRKENSDKSLFCDLESKDLYHFVSQCPYLRNDWTRF